MTVQFTVHFRLFTARNLPFLFSTMFFNVYTVNLKPTNIFFSIMQCKMHLLDCKQQTFLLQLYTLNILLFIYSSFLYRVWNDCSVVLLLWLSCLWSVAIVAFEQGFKASVWFCEKCRSFFITPFENVVLY